MKKEAKYSVSYCDAATGFGWTDDFKRLEEVEQFINEMRYNITVSITVWDRTLKDFIYWKDCLEYEPRINVMAHPLRDMRTKTRTVKMK